MGWARRIRLRSGLFNNSWRLLATALRSYQRIISMALLETPKGKAWPRALLQQEGLQQSWPYATRAKGVARREHGVKHCLLTLRYPIQPGGLCANGKFGRHCLLCLDVYVAVVDTRTQDRHTYFPPSLAAHLRLFVGVANSGGPASISPMCVPRDFVMVPH